MPPGAERPIQDPVLVGPSGLVLNLPARGQQPAEFRTGLESARNEVPSADDGGVGGETRQRRPRTFEKDAAFRKPALTCGFGRAAEMVGGRDPREGFEIGSRRFESSCKPAIRPRACLVSDERGRGQVVQHEGADLFDEPPGCAKPLQESPRMLHSFALVAGRAKLVGNRRLPEIVAQDREHQLVVAAAPTAELGRTVEGEHGVIPDVPLGMPPEVLGNADERFDLREEADEAGRPEKAESDGGSNPEQQEFAQLRVHPFGRELGEVETAGQGDQLFVGLELEARRELRRPKAAERVFGEVPAVGHPQPPCDQVLPAAVRVEYFAGKWVESHRVDAEIAPTGRGRKVQVRVYLDGKATVAGPGLVVAPWKREIGIESVDANDSEGAPYLAGPAMGTEKRLDLLDRQAEDLHVHVGG